MPVEGESLAENLTRREALKRGAALGGMLLWTTPAVQAIGMSRALAQETSGPCTTYCIKFNFTAGGGLGGSWGPLGNSPPQGQGNCFTCPPDAQNGSFPPAFFNDFEIVSGSRTTGVKIRFPNSCSLAEVDSTPDELNPGANVVAKCGNGVGSCSYQSPNQVPGPNGTTEIDVAACGNGRGISHIELIIRCCP